MKKAIWMAFPLLFLLAACTPQPQAESPAVVAAESFLADIAQNVAGERLTISPIIPAGVDPHEFEPAPQDVARLADASVIIVNGAGLEGWLDKVISSSGSKARVIVASAGLQNRSQGEPDPHYFTDPNLVIGYVENIRDGLIAYDPQGEAAYRQNADLYIARLKELDAWVRSQVETIPPERRKLVTNHESLGYFADRYGFTVTGTILPSVTSGASPSAQQLTALIEEIRAAQAPAIFLEAGANPQLADQVARETGVKVITTLIAHSLSAPDGPAATYLEMIRYNVTQIVQALK